VAACEVCWTESALIAACVCLHFLYWEHTRGERRKGPRTSAKRRTRTRQSLRIQEWRLQEVKNHQYPPRHLFFLRTCSTTIAQSPHFSHHEWEWPAPSNDIHTNVLRDITPPQPPYSSQDTFLFSFTISISLGRARCNTAFLATIIFSICVSKASSDIPTSYCTHITNTTRLVYSHCY
jgi:hypothetical protein